VKGTKHATGLGWQEFACPRDQEVTQELGLEDGLDLDK